MQSYIKLGGALLAAATIIGLGIKAIDAQITAQPGSSTTAEEPIKRTVLFRGNLDGVEGKEIVIFIADLAPGAVGSKPSDVGAAGLGLTTSQQIADLTVTLAEGATAVHGKVIPSSEGARLPAQLRVHLLVRREAERQDHHGDDPRDRDGGPRSLDPQPRHLAPAGVDQGR